MRNQDLNIPNTSTLKRIISIAIVVVMVVVGLPMLGMIIESVDADEVCVIQDPIDGDLHWYTSAGYKWQWFGKVTKYPKRSIYSFEAKEKDKDFRIKVRFNDGGHADMAGSIQYEMPLDPKNLTALHVRFGSAEAIQKQLVETVVNKSVYMTGPLMSSKESYAEKRNLLIHLVEDQVDGGVYKTIQRDVRIKDAITGAEKAGTTVEVVMKDGLPERQEEAQLRAFGIRSFNFSISSLDYDQEVEKQIQQQQQLIMDVQTAVAEAKKAEQRTLTVAEQGKASAASAKWEQEVIKAKEVTAAEQRKAVAQLDVQTAELRKKATILEGEGEAEKRRLVMSADGALDPKLRTWLESQKVWADAFKNYGGQLVPNVVMGNGSSHSGNAGQTATQLVELLTVKTARDLGLDMSMPRGRAAQQTQEKK